ncbi:MAG TPA: LysM peptidoglycan-binding domain-containing protein, partial [Pyrinomonadaceae bacterium]|nr:LysM peptidoglycan-binding domain-containing protein [Pyrinomonadaceae bacterium]
DATQKPASKEPSILQMEVPKQDENIVKRGDSLMEIPKQDKNIDKRGDSLMEVPKEVPKQDEYIVKRGDTLTEIAVKTGQNLQELLQKNRQIKNPNKIYVGQKIEVGNRSNDYTVKAGDTLSEIAKAKHTTVGEIMRANAGQIGNRNLIYPGQKLHIPVGTEKPAAHPKPPQPNPPKTNPNPTKPPVDTKPPVNQPPTTGGDNSTPTANGSIPLEQIAGVRGNPNVTPEFIKRVQEMAVRLDTKPEYLMAVMSFETGGTFSPSQPNMGGGSARGLIQFMPDTADGLGTSSDKLVRMSATEQLKYVEKYFQGFKGKLGTLEGTYTAVLRGRAYQDPNAVLFTQPSAAYRENSGLDFDRNGKITAAEATSAVACHLFGGVLRVENRLKELGFNPGKADNRFTAETSRAIGEFQKAKGLPVSGLLDERTGRAMGLAPGGSDSTTAPKPRPETAPTSKPESNAPASSTKLYTVRSGVVLTDKGKAKLAQIGAEYHRLTGSTFTVTSGTRTAHSQAQAMYTKLQLGDNLSVYRNKTALGEVKTAYNQARAAGKSPGEVVDAMSRVIENQTNRGVYISRHLRGGATDVSVRGLNEAAFRQALAKAGITDYVRETKPPHFHIQF